MDYPHPPQEVYKITNENMISAYMDENHNIIEGTTSDLAFRDRWSRCFSENKIVKQDIIGGFFISTVFLGMDHSFGRGPKLWFETMIFRPGGYDECYCERYSTYDQAVEGHKKVIGSFYSIISNEVPPKELFIIFIRQIWQKILSAYAATIKFVRSIFVRTATNSSDTTKESIEQHWDSL